MMRPPTQPPLRRRTPNALRHTSATKLNEMEQMCPRVKNYHVSVKELGKQIIFLHCASSNAAVSRNTRSVSTWRMAGMPMSVVSRADEILRNLGWSTAITRSYRALILSKAAARNPRRRSGGCEAGAPQNMQLSMISWTIRCWCRSATRSRTGHRFSDTHQGTQQTPASKSQKITGI